MPTRPDSQRARSGSPNRGGLEFNHNKKFLASPEFKPIRGGSGDMCLGIIEPHEVKALGEHNIYHHFGESYTYSYLVCCMRPITNVERKLNGMECNKVV